MNSGKTVNTWVDALSASFAGVQVIGQISAIGTLLADYKVCLAYNEKRVQKSNQV